MGAGNHGHNGESAIKDSMDPCDSIFIRGKEENCLRANKALLHLVATNIAVDVPFRLQCAMIVGKRSKWMRFICNKYWVWIEIPHPELQKDCVYVQGPVRAQLVPRATFVRQNWSPGPFLSVKLGPGRTHLVRQKWSYPCKNDPTRTIYQGRRNNPGCPGNGLGTFLHKPFCACASYRTCSTNRVLATLKFNVCKIQYYH